MSKPDDRNFAITGFTSPSSSTKSPITIALSSVPRNAAHEPSARPALIARPRTETCKSLRGKPTLYASPVFWPERPRTSSIGPVVTPWARASDGSNKKHNTIKQRSLVIINLLLMKLFILLGNSFGPSGSVIFVRRWITDIPPAVLRMSRTSLHLLPRNESCRWHCASLRLPVAGL